MSVSVTKSRKTPGVYVTELPAFPSSIVGVATAVPIFLGYTETARNPSSGAPMYLQAVSISSMADFHSYFGQGFAAAAIIAPQPVKDGKPVGNADIQAASNTGAGAITTGNYVTGTASMDGGVVPFTPRFNLYSAMELFFANGGGNCFVVSVANYWGEKVVAPGAGATPVTVEKQPLLDGLDVARVTRGPTMLVVPDACLLVESQTTADITTYGYDDYGAVAVEMLAQAGQLQDRVAILDMPGALVPANWTPAAMQDEATAFYSLIAPASSYFSYGACYGPALESSLLGTADVRYTDLAGTSASINLMNNLLTTAALRLYPATAADSVTGDVTYSPVFVDVAAHIAAAFPPQGPVAATPKVIPATTTGSTGATDTMLVALPVDSVPPPAAGDTAGINALDQYLVNAVPLLGEIQRVMADKFNIASSSGALAGIWTQSDAEHGVWNAPANLALNAVVAPKVIIDDAQQGGFNVPPGGNAINILRSMVNRGTVVWGARTLDGNSLDYRYIQVRRTLIYIDQSIKNALEQFVFAPNDGGTWTTVTATISAFLTQLWQAGGLMGDEASDAFTVQCGVPTTMSGLDVLNGYMIVNVTVQMIHPAEFIELTFTQTMQGV